MVCEILFSNLYLDLIEFEINYNYNIQLSQSAFFSRVRADFTPIQNSR
jgi:hypothetical protein